MTIRVLLADDHLVVRAGIRQFLAQSPDIEVIAEADDGLMAQALVNQHQPDVVVLDIHMPKANGIEVARWIRQTHPTIGILALTAYDDKPYIMAMLQVGIQGYILKTAKPLEVIQAVREVYAGKSVLDTKLTSMLMAHVRQEKSGAQPPKLSQRELDVLNYVGRGYTNKAIGLQLDISPRTVQTHLARIYRKLDVNNNALQNPIYKLHNQII